MRASVGDALMLLLAFWLVALWRRDRDWILRPSASALGWFLLPGLVMTVVFEALATGPWGRWTYADTMPVLPVVGTGVAPLLQWLLLPLLVVWLVRARSIACRLLSFVSESRTSSIAHTSTRARTCRVVYAMLTPLSRPDLLQMS